MDSKRDYYYDRKLKKLVVRRIRRVPRDPETNLPKRYVRGLTSAQKRKYKRSIMTTRRVYQKSRIVRDRKAVSRSLPYRRSSKAVLFEKKYGYKVTDLSRVKKDFPDTNVDKILAKGLGAYASGGSRASVTGQGAAQRWAYARLASVLVGGKALAVDKDLVGTKSLKKIYSK